MGKHLIHSHSMRGLFLLLAVGLSAPTSIAAEPLIGTARATDGDTLCVAGVKVRLEGMDAPELRRGQRCRRDGQRYNCGKDAKAALRHIVEGQRIECEPTYGDRYKRFVAVCRIDGKDIGDDMVRQGWAIDWPKYSNGKYNAAQDEAVGAKRGLWADGMTLPPVMYDRMSETFGYKPFPLPTNEEAKCRI